MKHESADGQVPDPPVQRSLAGFIGMLGATAAAMSANRLLVIAIPWFILTTTGSTAKTGLAAFCQITPFVVAQVLAGPLIDRIGPRRISIVGDSVAMGVMVAVPLMYAADVLSFAWLMVMVAVLGAAEGPAIAAKSVFVPSVARAARTTLERTTGLLTAVERTATVIGPVLAGVLVGALGGANALWLAAVLFGMAALITSVTLSNPVPEPNETVISAPEGYFARLRQGAAFLREERLLRAIVGMLILTNLLDQAFIAVLLPVWAYKGGYGAETVGLVVSVFAATSILAALVSSAVGDKLPRRLVYLVGFLIGGVPRFIVMALNLPLWAILATFAVGGLGSGFVNPIIGAVTYERIPASLLGRVRTLSSALVWSGIPLGGLFGAAMIWLSGVTGALWIACGCYIAAIVLPGFRPEWSQMRRRSRVHGEARSEKSEERA